MIRVHKLYRENFLSDELAKHPMREHLKPQCRTEGTRVVENLPVLRVSSKRKPKGYVVPYFTSGTPYWPNNRDFDSCWNRVNMYKVFGLDGKIKALYVHTLKQAIDFAADGGKLDEYKQYCGDNGEPKRCDVCASSTCRGCSFSIDPY